MKKVFALSLFALVALLLCADVAWASGRQRLRVRVKQRSAVVVAQPVVVAPAVVAAPVVVQSAVVAAPVVVAQPVVVGAAVVAQPVVVGGYQQQIQQQKAGCPKQ